MKGIHTAWKKLLKLIWAHTKAKQPESTHHLEEANLVNVHYSLAQHSEPRRYRGFFVKKKNQINFPPSSINNWNNFSSTVKSLFSSSQLVLTLFSQLVKSNRAWLFGLINGFFSIGSRLQEKEIILDNVDTVFISCHPIKLQLSGVQRQKKWEEWLGDKGLSLPGTFFDSTH